MTKKQKIRERSLEIQDEPGAEERFKGILRRALNTPPARKQKATKRKPAAQQKDKTR